MAEQTILIVDSDKITLHSLGNFLKNEGCKTICADSMKQAISKLQAKCCELVICDIQLGDGDGFELLDIIKKMCPQTVVVLMTAYGTIESAVRAIKQGAYDYLTKPIVDDELRLAVERALQQQLLMSENEQLRQQLEQRYSLESIISQNYKMAKIFDLVESVADTKTTILMTGPSGTGKSMLARAIHHRSSRKKKAFVEVSCGALPETLLESELFGHVKGSFTGAVSNKDGKFLAADGGTIFLDEISNASPALQVKLLRVLQDRQFEPVGSNKTKFVDTRILLATNTDLKEQVKKGLFREDLYYRVNVVSINLPPLNERLGDIPILANHFLKLYSLQHKRHKLGITDEALALLERYRWPGNVRELENAMERAVLLSKGKFITIKDFPANITADTNNTEQQFSRVSLKEALAEPEKNIIRQTLQANHYSRQQTAKALGINRTTLFKKMKQYGLYEEVEQLGLM